MELVGGSSGFRPNFELDCTQIGTAAESCEEGVLLSEQVGD